MMQVRASVNFDTFASDVMFFGAVTACEFAEALGVSGGTMARWLARLAANV